MLKRFQKNDKLYPTVAMCSPVTAQPCQSTMHTLHLSTPFIWVNVMCLQCRCQNHVASKKSINKKTLLLEIIFLQPNNIAWICKWFIFHLAINLGPWPETRSTDLSYIIFVRIILVFTHHSSRQHVVNERTFHLCVLPGHFDHVETGAGGPGPSSRQALPHRDRGWG